MTGWRPASRSAPILLALALCACRSVDPGFGLAGTAPAEPTSASGRTSPEPAEAAMQPIQFLPVIGIPADRAPTLSAALAAAAAANGVPILPAAGGVAAQRLKGYLSAMRGPDGTLVVYVWDIVDPAGNRIDRIQGQVQASGSGESWTGVGDDTLQAVARETIAALVTHGQVALRPAE